MKERRRCCPFLRHRKMHTLPTAPFISYHGSSCTRHLVNRGLPHGTSSPDPPAPNDQQARNRELHPKAACLTSLKNNAKQAQREHTSFQHRSFVPPTVSQKDFKLLQEKECLCSYTPISAMESARNHPCQQKMLHSVVSFLKKKQF